MGDCKPIFILYFIGKRKQRERERERERDTERGKVDERKLKKKEIP